METIEKFLVNFNRVYLRFTPSTICIFLFLITWILFYSREVDISSSIVIKYLIQENIFYALFGLFVISGALSVILTWPMLILHVYRFKAIDVKLLAEKREEGELTDTIRHCREYGSNMINVGGSIFQLFYLLNEVFYSRYGERLEIFIIPLCGISVVTGIIVWLRGVNIEEKLLNKYKDIDDGSFDGDLKQALKNLWKCLKLDISKWHDFMPNSSKKFAITIIFLVSCFIIFTLIKHDNCTLFAKNKNACISEGIAQDNEVDFMEIFSCNILFVSGNLAPSPLKNSSKFQGCAYFMQE